MTTDAFTTAARAEAQCAYQNTGMPRYDLAVHMAEWTRDHLAAQEPTDAEVEAAAIIIARTVSFDADPDLAGYRALGLDVLTAARRVRAARAARRDEEKHDG